MISLKTPDWVINDIETVLFDKDGTFIDLHYFWGKMTELRVQEIIKQYKAPESLFKKLCLYLGYNIDTGKMLADGITALYSRSKIIEIFKENLCTEGILISTKDLEKLFDKVSSEFYKNMILYTKPIPNAIDFIKTLHKYGIRLGIVTSDSVTSTELTLKQFKWDNLFDVVIGRESSQETKESGIPTKIALEKLGANPKTTIMVGDAPMDFISAHNAGIDSTILVETGQLSFDELLKVSKYTVKNLSEIEITKRG